MSHRAPFLAAAAWALLCLPLSAEGATRTFDYRPVDRIQEISLSVGEIRISRIAFQAARESSIPVRRSNAECVVRVDNDGSIDVQVGVAVAIFDADGNIVAAGSGATRAVWLSAGEHGTSTIRFPYLFRNLDRARTFTVTMEVEPRLRKGETPEAPAPTPAPR
jgi:hypothetical protein